MAYKTITLESTNCKIRNDQFGFYVNGEALENILNKQFKDKLEEYKEYLASVKIEISVFEEEELQIKKNWEDFEINE